MLTIGDPFPAFTAKAVVSLERGHEFATLSNTRFDGKSRSPAEVLRVLDALQTEGLCPCNWHKGEATLSAA